MAIGLLDGAFALRSGDLRGGIVEGNIHSGKSV
jgi:hypothetical protein